MGLFHGNDQLIINIAGMAQALPSEEYLSHRSVKRLFSNQGFTASQDGIIGKRT